MQLHQHLLWSTTAALITAPRWPWPSAIAWAASLLVDVDHIAWFCVAHRSPNIVAACRFFAHPPPGAGWSNAPMVLHHPAVPLALLALGRWGQGPIARGAGAVGAGIAFHQGLDIIGDSTAITTRRWRSWRRARRKAAVKRRDGWVCQQCGQQGEPLEVHHRVPPEAGGREVIDNLFTLCPPCHDQAHGRPPRASPIPPTP